MNYNKSNFSLYPLYDAEACYEFAEPSPRHCAGKQHSLFEDMLQRWRVVGNSVPDLTSPRFEP